MTKFDKRAADWRNGGIVYQVFVDRFAPADNLEQKLEFYQKPRKLRKWSEKAKRQSFCEDSKVWKHELDFWGGDLKSLENNLDYINSLGADVVYLNPIFESLTNHKYDTWDYFKIDPCYGDRKDLKCLADSCHKLGMKLVLDGVFNHVGAQSPLFKKSQSPLSNDRNLFRFASSGKPIGWNNVLNLPELNLDNPKVLDFLYRKHDSVIQSYIKEENIDGWRLDVAYEFGFEILRDITRAAHEAKSDSVVIGEIWNYPEEWHPAVDGVMNMHCRSIILRLISGDISPELSGKFLETMIEDAGIEHLLKAWLVLDNHDTPRLASVVSDLKKQKFARILQFTLPGTVCLYYGSEFGMKGRFDPEQRSPMPWQKLKKPSTLFQLHKTLCQLRKDNRALRIGDFRRLNSKKSLAFLRRTDMVSETMIVVANPSDETVREAIQIRDSRIHDDTLLQDALSSKQIKTYSGFIDFKISPWEVLVLKPVITDRQEAYSRYKYMK